MSTPPSLPSAPRRVVSLVPSLTESLFDLGLGDCVVGATDYCTHPASGLARVPRVGGPKTPRFETILSLEPELVIASREENRREDVEKLVAAGVSVWVTFPHSVSETIALLWQMILLFEVPDQFLGLRSIETSLEWVERANAADEPVRTFCPIWHDPWMTISGDTFTSDLLRVCGAQNIFGDQRGDRYPIVTLDEVAARSPDLILLPSEPFSFDENHLAEISAKDSIPAVQTGRVLLVDGTLLTWYGTRLGKALQQVPGWIRPR